MITWCGQDIETLSREQLIEIIIQLDRQLTSTRKQAARSITFLQECHLAARVDVS